ncbi:unnamed protein product [Owenia fusiformis]|uniref:Uncharacterized protein n=1 Tax=Owenia fusiformis TaxID=6347 RepID=A0A8J1UVR9_OWEFU|nr:unnamed protein product [Owenia fusiformis]
MEVSMKPDAAEEKLNRFLQYDFENDARFQEGLKSLEKSQPFNGDTAKEDVQMKLLDAQLFYYSRFFEKITKEEYTNGMSKKPTAGVDAMKSDNSKNINTDLSEDEDIVNDKNEDDNQALAISAPGNQVTITNDVSEQVTAHASNNRDERHIAQSENDLTVLDAKHDEITDDKGAKPKKPDNKMDKDGTLSLSQLLDLVESGQTIPGLENLNIEATGAAPTQSAASRPKKPWEKD